MHGLLAWLLFSLQVDQDGTAWLNYILRGNHSLPSGRYCREGTEMLWACVLDVQP